MPHDSHREPRIPRPRPPAPPAEAVARAAHVLTLRDASPESREAALGVLVAYVRADPGLGRRLLRLEALADLEQFAAPAGELETLSLRTRQGIVARRHRIGVRTLERWRLGR